MPTIPARCPWCQQVWNIVPWEELPGRTSPEYADRICPACAETLKTEIQARHGRTELVVVS